MIKRFLLIILTTRFKYACIYGKKGRKKYSHTSSGCILSQAQPLHYVADLLIYPKMLNIQFLISDAAARHLFTKARPANVTFGILYRRPWRRLDLHLVRV